MNCHAICYTAKTDTEAFVEFIKKQSEITHWYSYGPFVATKSSFETKELQLLLLPFFKEDHAFLVFEAGPKMLGGRMPGNFWEFLQIEYTDQKKDE